MNLSKTTESIGPRQIKAVVIAVLAIMGLALVGIAFGQSQDHINLAQEMLTTASQGPVGQVVNVLYYLF